MNLISIDLETLGVDRDSAILEIGIVVGDDNGNILERFQVFPDLDEQLANGRRVSGDTIMWWFKQDSVLMQEQATAKRLSMQACIEEVTRFLKPYLAPGGKTLVLGNAPGFDCDMLSDFLGVKLWPFWAERDVRTARMKVPFEKRAVNHKKHCALADAEQQYADFVTFLAL